MLLKYNFDSESILSCSGNSPLTRSAHFRSMYRFDDFELPCRLTCCECKVCLHLERKFSTKFLTRVFTEILFRRLIGHRDTNVIIARLREAHKKQNLQKGSNSFGNDYNSTYTKHTAKKSI